MNPELLIPLIGTISVFGTIITVVVVRSRQKIRLKEYELEQMRLENEARQLSIEEKRLQLTLLDKTSQY